MFLDRSVAAVAAMAATLYFLAGALAWYRTFRPRPTTPSYIKSVILDRAFAWSSLSIIFFTVAGIKLGWYHWSDDYIDGVRIVAFVTIFLCGLISIGAMTYNYCGITAVSWFATLSLLVGLGVLWL